MNITTYLPQERKLFYLSGFLLTLSVMFSWVLLLMAQGRFGKEAEIFVSEYVPTRLRVDASKEQGGVQASWTAFAQGGEEAGVSMIAGTQDELKKLKPTYIRLDHVFDDDYYGVFKSLDNPDWGKLDETVRDIQATGAVPFFSLGYMPQSVADTKINVPRDWGLWQRAVRSFMEHYSGSLGIENVYYEVWNEPDLESFGSWKYSGDKSYVILYDVAARAAKELRGRGDIKPFKFGGPGITALYRNWIMAVVNHSRNNGLPLDFISWHRYSFYPWRFTQDMNEVESWVGKNSYEFIISEWGPDSEKNPIYAGNYSAAHAVAVSRAVLNRLDWGYVFEVKDGPGQNKEGWGVFTHQDSGLSAKPRFYGLAFLNDMSKGQRVAVSGEGSSIYSWAVKEDKDLRLIASNFNPYGGGSETFPVEFVNLQPGQYRFRWETLNGQKKDEIFQIESEAQAVSEQFTLAANDILKVTLTQLQPFIRSTPPSLAQNTGAQQQTFVQAEIQITEPAKQVSPASDSFGNSPFGRLPADEVVVTPEPRPAQPTATPIPPKAKSEFGKLILKSLEL